jgi:hypothetical protein
MMLTCKKQQRPDAGHVRQGLPLLQSATPMVNELHFCGNARLPIVYSCENALSRLKYANKI